MIEPNRSTIPIAETDRLLRAREVQDKLGVSRATAYRMMTDGTLPVVRFGGGRKRARRSVRVLLRDLLAWIETNRHGAAS